MANTTYDKQLLSGSTNGKGIKITTSASTGDTIHTAHATSLDEIWVWVVNTSATAVKITGQFGGTTATDNDIEQTIPPESGLIPFVMGLPLTGSLVFKIWAGTANVIVAYGYVNRIS